MQRYQDLLNDAISFQDLTDAELTELRRCWIGKYNKFLPDEHIWDMARREQDQRQKSKATAMADAYRAKRAGKVKHDFFKE
jgi:hypothetical protein